MPYIITDKTNVLIPKKSLVNPQKIITEIFETDQTIISEEAPADIIMYNCVINGASLSGRQQGSAYLLGCYYKPPIILNEREIMILIPTNSHRNPNCCWLNLTNILTYYSSSPKTTTIEFKNMQKVELKITYSILDKQILRATRLESTLRRRNGEFSK